MMKVGWIIFSSQKVSKKPFSISPILWCASYGTLC